VHAKLVNVKISQLFDESMMILSEYAMSTYLYIVFCREQLALTVLIKSGAWDGR